MGVTFLSLLTAYAVTSYSFLRGRPCGVMPRGCFRGRTRTRSFLANVCSGLKRSAFCKNSCVILTNNSSLRFCKKSAKHVSGAKLVYGGAAADSTTIAGL